eukprot:255281-Karenia_brevis.AAC.1
MEHGLDLTVTTKHCNWYIKQRKMSQAGALCPQGLYGQWKDWRKGTQFINAHIAHIARGLGMMKCIWSTHAQP